MNAAPEHSYLDRKIQRAYDRMMLANTRRWAYAWGDVLYRYVMKKGRAPLSGEQGSPASVAYRGVTTSGEKSMSSLLYMQMGQK